MKTRRWSWCSTQRPFIRGRGRSCEKHFHWPGIYGTWQMVSWLLRMAAGSSAFRGAEIRSGRTIRGDCFRMRRHLCRRPAKLTTTLFRCARKLWCSARRGRDGLRMFVIRRSEDLLHQIRAVSGESDKADEIERLGGRGDKKIRILSFYCGGVQKNYKTRI